MGSGRYALAWLAIWLPSHLTAQWIVSEHYLDVGSQEGFAAMMGMLIWLYPTLGILASYFVAKVTRREWTYFAGAPVVGFGVGLMLIAPDGLGYLWVFLIFAFCGLAIGGAVMALVERARAGRRLEQ